jgi:ABC-type Mn2+/Zn2+ transport system permease subunit
MLYLLFGNRLSISPGQIVGLAVLAVIVALVHALFHKEFVFVSFDPDMAQALGVRPRLWNIVLFLTLGVTISIAIRAAGALAVFGLLVLPAATALLVCRNLRLTFIVAVAVGAVCSLVGIAVSSMADLPTGPTIVAVNVVPVAIASLVRRQR